MRKLYYVLFFLILSTAKVFGVDYNASEFGCISDGQTNNTRSIQAAIDLISSKGGGTLNFYVGRYLTGGLELKSNVTLKLHEGAVLVASDSFYDFLERNGKRYMIYADNQSQVNIIGKGVIQGQSAAVLASINKQYSNGIISGTVMDLSPILIGIYNCRQVELNGIMLNDSAGDIIHIEHSSEIVLKDQIIKSRNSNSRGIVLLNSIEVQFEDLFVDISGKALDRDKLSRIKKIKKSITPNGKSIL